MLGLCRSVCGWLILVCVKVPGGRSLKDVKFIKIKKITSSSDSADVNGERQFHKLGENLQRDAGLDIICHSSSWSPEQYASSVKEFSAHNFNDESLRKLMVKHSDTAFLYTNGGIVPAGTA